MSNDIGLNSNISVAKKKLHIQTSFLKDSHRASSCIFEGGELIDKRESFIDKEIPFSRLQKEVKQFHNLVISDLELLFFVFDKVQSSKHAPSVIRLGRLFLEKGFYDEAIELFLLAHKLDASYQNCQYELGQAYFKKGAYQESLETLLVAIERNPDYPDIHLLLGKTYWKLAKHHAAIKQVREAIRLNKEYHLAYFTLGLFLIESTLIIPKHKELTPPIERIKEAGEYIKRAVSLSPAYDATLIAAGFDKLGMRGKTEEAISDFEQAYNPSVTISKSAVIESEFYLKFMFAGLDKDNKALEHFIKTIEKSVIQHPDYADLRQSLGTAYLIKGWHYFVKATEKFREAVEINPQYEKAQKNLKLLENDGRGFLILLRAILK